MRKLFAIMTAIILMAIVCAQSPQRMSYQPEIRNSTDQLVTSHADGMRISILQGFEIGTPVYLETQTPTPNTNNLVAIEIGSGTPVTETFVDIDWSAGPYYIKTETDNATPLTTYNITGTNQLLSVPYALYAQRTIEHYVGEFYGGGVVFWVDQTGGHGLICSMIDLGTPSIWSNVSSTIIGTNAQSDRNGQGNTNAIMRQSGHTSSAAKLCDDYTNANYGTGIYSDWYLPGIGELNDLWNNLKVVLKALDSDGNSATTSLVKSLYWSSSEYNDNYALAFNFSYGYSNYYFAKSNTSYIRAVRAF